MADFIVFNNKRLELVSRFNYVKGNNVSDESISKDIEDELGNFPLYGNIKVLFEENPELDNFKTRIYENFSRHGQNTLYVPEVDLLIIKLPEKTVGPRTKHEEE